MSSLPIRCYRKKHTKQSVQRTAETTVFLVLCRPRLRAKNCWGKKIISHESIASYFLPSHLFALGTLGSWQLLGTGTNPLTVAIQKGCTP
jgi:hypothetical protein